MSLKEHDIRLIEDFIVESLNEDSLEEFSAKKATSREFYDLLTMQDEVLHDLTSGLYKASQQEERPQPVELVELVKKSSSPLSFENMGFVLMILAGIGLCTTLLILMATNGLNGI